MSVEKFKQQAKRLHKLVTASLAPDAKLSECQELLAQTLGFPSFHDALSELARSACHEVDAKAAERNSASEVWAVRRDCTDADGELTRATDLRIVTGAENAFALLWLWFNNHLNERDEPPLRNKCAMAIVACSEAGADADTALEVKFAWPNTSVRLLLYPLEADTLLVGERVAEPDPAIARILSRRQGPNDVEVMERASQSIFNAVMKNVEQYEQARPSRSFFASFDEHIRKMSKEKKKHAAPHELIYTLEEWQVRDWRFRLIYFGGAFQFDVYNGRVGSLIVPVEEACLKLSKSGQWTAETLRGSSSEDLHDPLKLEGLRRSETDRLKEVAAECGVTMILEGVRVAGADRPTPSMRKFMDWASTHAPTLSFS